MRPFITNPAHGGKITCDKCNGFIEQGDEVKLLPEAGRTHDIWFHIKCYNGYEHYYGHNKPID